MIFRLKTAEGARGDLKAGIAHFRDVVSECCVDVEGFRAGYFLVEKKSGRMVTLTLWTDRKALKQGLRNLARRAADDAAVAATIERLNAHGVRFDTFELAHEIAPRRARGPHSSGAQTFRQA